MLVLKYVVPKYPFPTLYFGIANVIANGLIMLRSSPDRILTGEADFSQFCRFMGFAEYGG